MNDAETFAALRELSSIPDFGTPGTGTDGGDHFADDMTLCGSGTIQSVTVIDVPSCRTHRD